MLKPRYKSLSESVSDFKRMLDGMDVIQPLEYNLHEELKVLEAMEVQVFAESDPAAHDRYADRLGRAADQAGRRGNVSLRKQLLVKQKRNKARAQMLRRKPKDVEESVELSEAVMGGAPAVYQVDADIRLMLDSVWHYMPGHLKTELYALCDEEQKLVDIEEQANSGRITLTEADKAALGKRHDKAADRWHTLANKHGRKSRTAHSPSERDQYGKMHDAARRKAKHHEKKTKRYTGKRNLVNSVDPAPMSQYRTESSAIRSFRVLAGLDETPLMPRDPGLSGTTKWNGSYFEEGYGKDHSEKMHDTADDLKKAAKTIKKHHKGKGKDKDCKDDDGKEMEERATMAGYERRKAERTKRSIDPLAAKAGKGPASSPETAKSRIKTSLDRLKKQPKPNLPEAVRRAFARARREG